jgi:hypothetical protein
LPDGGAGHSLPSSAEIKKTSGQTKMDGQRSELIGWLIDRKGKMKAGRKEK